MITLLRKVRKNMLNQSKFSRYLLYAFGEIILVVIGILIPENLAAPEVSGLKGGFS